MTGEFCHDAKVLPGNVYLPVRTAFRRARLRDTTSPLYDRTAASSTPLAPDTNNDNQGIELESHEKSKSSYGAVL